jgi:ribosomal protein L12E/L44/L45/RPP1/RPP2
MGLAGAQPSPSAGVDITGETVKRLLAVNVEGATVDEIVKGIAAAQAIFAKAGTTAYGAASARLRREGYADYLDEDGKISEDSMTDEEARVCMVWEEAEEAAIAACCEGWAVKPTSAYLELVEIPATKPHPKAA